ISHYDSLIPTRASQQPRQDIRHLSLSRRIGYAHFYSEDLLKISDHRAISAALKPSLPPSVVSAHSPYLDRDGNPLAERKKRSQRPSVHRSKEPSFL
ncbi:hypothetical protein HBI24_251180, partial [Parastagonospora nodorum]